MSPRITLGVDLALARGRDVGSARITFNDDRLLAVDTAVLALNAGRVSAHNIVEAILAVHRDTPLAALALDGPQGWRRVDDDTARRWRSADLEARCPGKCGVRGVVAPATMQSFVALSIEVFTTLVRRADTFVLFGLEDTQHRDHDKERATVLECFPTATWRTMGLTPLPAKRRATRAIVRQYAERLAAAVRLPAIADTDDHDTLQAVVAALSAVAAVGGPLDATRFGESPRITRDHSIEEGFIVAASPLQGLG